VIDPADLQGLLARLAGMLDASGIVVWLGGVGGPELRPVLAHGYPDHILTRMPNVPRSADNAAAAAYRTGKLQIVLRRPGASNGAIVAPLLGPKGCIGALSAEILGGGETTDGVQALAALVAAQLASLLAESAAIAVEAEAPLDRIALA
jgi:GAF domain-containing protein